MFFIRVKCESQPPDNYNWRNQVSDSYSLSPWCAFTIPNIRKARNSNGEMRKDKQHGIAVPRISLQGLIFCVLLANSTMKSPVPEIKKTSSCPSVLLWQRSRAHRHLTCMLLNAAGCVANFSFASGSLLHAHIPEGSFRFPQIASADERCEIQTRVQQASKTNPTNSRCGYHLTKRKCLHTLSR